MADTKISALTDGSTAELTDVLPAQRSTGNVKLTLEQIKSLVGVGTTEYATFAELLAATGSLTVGRVYTVTGPICSGGERGTRWVYDGTLIRPACVQVLSHTVTQIDGISGGTTDEQILWSPSFSGSVLRGCRHIRVQSRIIFSATEANARSLRWRVGSAGTSSDTNFVGNTATASQRQAVLPGSFAPVGATTAIFSGSANTFPTSPDVIGGFTNAAGSPFSVGDLTGTTYLSLTVQQGASPTATASLAWAQIIVE